MKKILLILALIITNFAIAKNTDDLNATILEQNSYPFPTGLNISSSNNYWNSTTVTWVAAMVNGTVPTNLRGYQLYYKRSTDTNYTSYKSVAANVTSVILTNVDLPLPMNYSLYVQAMYEDNIIAPSDLIYYSPNQTIAPPSLFKIDSSTATSQGFTLTWNASTSYNIVGYYVYANGLPVGFSNTTSCVVTGLNPNTIYNVTAAAVDMYDNVSVTPAPTTVTTRGYCIPAPVPASSDSGSYIKQVNLTSLTNPASVLKTSNGNTYNDYTANTTIFAALNAGTSAGNVLKVTVACDGARDAHMLVLIDFDFDGVFEDSERILMGFLPFKGGVNSNITTGVPITFVSGPIAVPSNAYLGTVLMRIMYQRFNSLVSDSFSPADQFSCDLAWANSIPAQGEIQDYNVIISDPSVAESSIKSRTVSQKNETSISLESIPDATDFKLFPNPVSGDIMNITIIDDNTPYHIINMHGQKVSDGKVDNGTISVSNLSSGNYFIEIENKDQRIVKRFIKQ
ncbi:fibronectin type III domain-containing protein [Flavobacterium sp. GSP14]|uniref:fibronectin type III domain-containing protein n=1 Tax=Flavobacterium sp. GSP14 TaxID=3401734 RepID=UPI003AAE2004